MNLIFNIKNMKKIIINGLIIFGLLSINSTFWDTDCISINDEYSFHFEYDDEWSIPIDNFKKLWYCFKETNSKYFLTKNNISLWNKTWYDNIYWIKFSDDGKDLVFVWERNGKSEVVFNEKIINTYNFVTSNEYEKVIYPEMENKTFISNFVFSGNNISYNVYDNNQSYAVINWEKGKIYDFTHKTIYSDNGKNTAYLAIKDGKMFVVVNKKEWIKLDYINKNKWPGCTTCLNNDYIYSIIFLDDNNVAYSVKSNGNNYIYLNNKIIFSQKSNYTQPPLLNLIIRWNKVSFFDESENKNYEKDLPEIKNIESIKSSEDDILDKKIIEQITQEEISLDIFNDEESELLDLNNLDSYFSIYYWINDPIMDLINTNLKKLEKQEISKNMKISNGSIILSDKTLWDIQVHFWDKKYTVFMDKNQIMQVLDNEITIYTFNDISEIKNALDNFIINDKWNGNLDENIDFSKLIEWNIDTRTTIIQNKVNKIYEIFYWKIEKKYTSKQKILNILDSLNIQLNKFLGKNLSEQKMYIINHLKTVNLNKILELSSK